MLDCDWASSDKPVLLAADNCIRLMDLEMRQACSPTDMYQYTGELSAMTVIYRPSGAVLLLLRAAPSSSHHHHHHHHHEVIINIIIIIINVTRQEAVSQTCLYPRHRRSFLVEHHG